MDEKHEKFYAEIIATSDVARITIPKNIMVGSGMKFGDKVKIWIQKVDEK